MSWWNIAYNHCLSIFIIVITREKYNLASQIITLSLDGPLNYQDLHFDPPNNQNL
jgi:hypothetical protein